MSKIDEYQSKEAVAFALFNQLKSYTRESNNQKTPKEMQEYDLALFLACLNAVKGAGYTIPE